MASEIRLILDCITPTRLREICEERGLPTGGDQYDKRERLSRSFRGELDELLPLLHRGDMIAYLGEWTFHDDDDSSVLGHLAGLSAASRNELEAMVRKVVAGWNPIRGERYPLGPDSSIRFEEEDLAFDEQDEDEQEEDFAGSGVDGKSTEDEFIEWLVFHMEERPKTNLLIKTLVNKLANYRAQQRLTTRAVHDLARVLAGAGFRTEPDLGSMTQSPGITTRVTIHRGAASGEVRGRQSDDHSSWSPIPSPSERARSAAAPVRRMSTIPPAGEFERSALKLQFLVLVTAAIQKPDEGVRRLAVELATRNTSLGPADHIRLRALAHQYSTGHGDLHHVLPQLRDHLGAVDRADLLKDLRALAPTTPELDELIEVYATDLAVPAAPPIPDAAAAPSAHSAQPEPPARTTSAVRAPEPAPVLAGGVRENPALDLLFAAEKPR